MVRATGGPRKKLADATRKWWHNNNRRDHSFDSVLTLWATLRHRARLRTEFGPIIDELDDDVIQQLAVISNTVNEILEHERKRVRS